MRHGLHRGLIQSFLICESMHMHVKIHKIHHEGTNILIGIFLILTALNLPLWLWMDPKWTAISVTAVSVMFFLLVLNFFRSPIRHFDGDRKSTVVSSVDGRVVALEEVYEPEFLKKKCLQLSVFMSVLNVHANWFPVDGEVTYVKHHSGRFMAAYLPKSSAENERSTVVIRTAGGQNVLMRQVAGALARRIVTYARPGEEANIDYHMGFIKFGSRVDIYLPLGSTPLVKIGEITTGGVTPVATLPQERPEDQDNP